MTKKDFLPGKHLHTEENIVKKVLTFQKLRHLVKDGFFKKPDCQGALLEEKVKSMIENYLENPENFQYKNTIIVGVINNQFYILDGQHRVQMIEELCKYHQKYSKTVIVAYYPLKNHQEALRLFNEINIDSSKNQFYISQDHFGQIVINEFRSKLKDIYKSIFSRKKTENGRRKCIEEFVDELYTIKFLDNKTANEAFEQLTNLNTIYYDKIYKSHVEDGSLETLIYKDEQKSIIDRKICFISKKNNFVDFVKDNNIAPHHTWKKGKKRITKTLRRQVWYKEFEHKETATCPIVHCNNTISKNNFEAGHVISEFNNGPTELSNLRPICHDCNIQMGSKNWDKYDIC